MDDSWTSKLAGRSIEGIEQSESSFCVIRLSGGYHLRIESLWRILSAGTLVLTSQDEGQPYGLGSPIQAIEELSNKLLAQTVSSIVVTPGTADLTLNFGKLSLQVISDSSGYEAWQVEGPAGTVAVGQGGGNVVLY